MMADPHSALPVQSKSPTGTQGDNEVDDENALEPAELPLEIEAPPKIDVNALKNEILTDGMQVRICMHA